MRKTMKMFLFVVLITLLSGCKVEKIDINFDDHYTTVDGFTNVAFEKELGYQIGDQEREFLEYYYINNETGDMCASPSMNGSSGDYTVSCTMVFTNLDGEQVGIYPFKTNEDKYEVYNQVVEVRLDKMILSLLSEEDRMQDTPDYVYFSKEVAYKDLPYYLQKVVAGGQPVGNKNNTVEVNAYYNKDLGYFDTLQINFVEFLNNLYELNLGSNPEFDAYYLDITISQLVEELRFLVPNTDLIRDDYVDYIEDGEYLGFTFLKVDEVVSGEFESINDIEIMIMDVELFTPYEIVVSGTQGKIVTYQIFNKLNELMFEGAISDAVNNQDPVILTSGEYYLVIRPDGDEFSYQISFQEREE